MYHVFLTVVAAKSTVPSERYYSAAKYFALTREAAEQLLRQSAKGTKQEIDSLEYLGTPSHPSRDPLGHELYERACQRADKLNHPKQQQQKAETKIEPTLASAAPW